MGSYPELESYVSPFVSAFQNEEMEKLEVQIASAKISLSRIVSPQLYWVVWMFFIDPKFCFLHF